MAGRLASQGVDLILVEPKPGEGSRLGPGAGPACGREPRCPGEAVLLGALQDPEGGIPNFLS